jgi:hypothetical protein
MEITSIGAALEIVNKSWKALEAVRERAQLSKDAPLKASIGELYDQFLSLKAIIVRLTDENSDLKRVISQSAEKSPKPEIRQVGETNYYYVADVGPYCQRCYDGDGKLVALTPQHTFAGGVGRKCPLCLTVAFEATKTMRPVQRRPQNPWS